MRQLLALVPLLTVVTLSAQTPAAVFIGGQQPPAPPWDAPHLEFEVASVKSNKTGPAMMAMRTLPTSFNVTNVPLRLLITQAYRLSGYQMVGAPSSIDSERFDIVAKAPEGSRPDQTMLMLRGLLAERFKLKVHSETRETQVYALLLARSDGKLGPKLSKSTDDCEKNPRGTARGRGSGTRGRSGACSLHDAGAERKARLHDQHAPGTGFQRSAGAGIPGRGPDDAGAGESDLRVGQ